MARILNLDESVKTAFNKVHSNIALNTEFQIRDMIPNSKIKVIGSKDYDNIILGILIVLGVLTIGVLLIVAIAYYFTREFKTITFRFDSTDSDQCVLTIIDNGKNVDNFINDSIYTLNMS